MTQTKAARVVRVVRAIPVMWRRTAYRQIVEPWQTLPEGVVQVDVRGEIGTTRPPSVGLAVVNHETGVELQAMWDVEYMETSLIPALVLMVAKTKASIGWNIDNARVPAEVAKLAEHLATPPYVPPDAAERKGGPS